MATNVNIPIPQNPIGENYPWRDWFQKLSNKVYGSLASQNSNGVTITGGTIDNTAIGSTTPSTGSFTSLTLSAPLKIAYGGTNGFAVPTAGAVAYGNGGAYAFTAVGSTGQFLTSNGGAAPTWTTITFQSTAAPVTVITATYTVGTTDLWIINNYATGTTTLTLPVASSYSGRVLYIQNYKTNTVVSSGSNVIPLVGGSASAAILNAIAGDTATLVSNGTSWVMTQYVPNNILLLG